MPPGTCFGFKDAHQQTASVFFHIGVTIMVSEYRQVGGNVWVFFSDRVIVLTGVQWDVDVMLSSQVTSPQTCAIYNKV